MLPRVSQPPLDQSVLWEITEGRGAEIMGQSSLGEPQSGTQNKQDMSHLCGW